MENSRQKILAAVAVLGLVVAALAARPAYRVVRTWRAEKLAAQAEGAIRSQNWPEASQKAQAAYHLDPTSPDAMRVVARLYSIAGQPSAVTFWGNLSASGHATVEDRRELVRAGMRFGKISEVRAEAFRLAADKPPIPENLRLASEFCLLAGDRSNALAFSRELAKLRPEPRSELLLAQSLVATRGSAEQAQARSMLIALAERTNSVGLDARVTLARANLVSDKDLPSLIEGLAGHPESRLPHRLLAEELRLRLKPHERGISVARFVEEFADSPLTNRVEVARWLNNQKEYARSAQLLRAGEAARNRDAFLIRMDALAALGQWKSLRSELETEGAPIEPVLRELFLARSARQLNLGPEADAHWRRVHLELATQPEAVLYVAEYAEKTGAIEEARKAYEKLTIAPEYAEKAFAALIRIAEQTGGTRTLREMMRDLSARRPDDPAPANDFAYLNLLLGERLEESRDIARKLHEAEPNIMAFRTTLALACLRLNDPATAKSLYEGLHLDWGRLQPGWQAVHAAVVAASGQTNLARTLTRQIPLSRLKPEERELVRLLL